MQELFCRILEMSLKGAFCIGVVLLIRLVLVKLRRRYAYYLWIAVFLNLIFPFTIQGKFSLIPKQAAEFSVEIDENSGQLLLPALSAGSLITPVSGTEEISGEQQRNDTRRHEDIRHTEDFRSMKKADESSKTISVRFLQNIWLSGMVVIFISNLIHVFRVKSQISSDKRIHWDEEHRIAEVRGLPSPFLWGIFRPVIFLPTQLEERERTFIIMHESCHRRRKDPLFKLAAFGAVALHWFNPAVWLAWVLFCRDMEISCDEAVLVGSGKETRSRYAQSILRYAAMQNGYFMTPPAFGEPSARIRIKYVLQDREPGRVSDWVAGSIVVMAAFGLIVHPVRTEMALNLDLSEYMNVLALKNNNMLKNVIAGLGEAEAGTKETETIVNEPDFADDQLEIWHREGYMEAAVTHIPLSVYFTPELWDEKELDNLAQQALQELYDLTGFQVESCVYGCSDLGTFFFAKTEEDLQHSRTFYSRSYGEKEGYDSNMIPSMDIANARRVWFSDVQQLEIPDGIESMGEEELAAWFLKSSSIYQGEKLVDIQSSPDMEAFRIITEEGSFYEVSLDTKIQSVSSIYGPYPEGIYH